MLVKHFYFVIEVENNSFTIKILQCMKITVHIAFTLNITLFTFEVRTITKNININQYFKLLFLEN